MSSFVCRYCGGEINYSNLTDIVFTLRVELESDPTMQVFGYDSPVTALVEFEPNFYDLLLIDVNMPLLDGFQLAQNLLRTSMSGFAL